MRKAFSKRGGGLVWTGAPVRMAAPRIVGASVSYNHLARVGDDQGQDGACAVFGVLSAWEIMNGQSITNSECLARYHAKLKQLKRPVGSGLTVDEAMDACSDRFPGRKARGVRDFGALKNGPLLLALNAMPCLGRTRHGIVSHTISTKPTGPHLVVLTEAGYRPADDRLWLTVENSWGLRWGEQGLGQMLAALFDRIGLGLWEIT